MTFPNWHIHTSYFVIAAVLALGSYVGVHSWIEEHDARVRAEVTLAKDEQVVKGLQDQIVQNNQQVQVLQQQMEQRDSQNAQVIAQLVKAKQQAVTPPQQVQVLNTEAKLPDPITSIPGTSDWRLPERDVQPLFGAVSDGLVAVANLTTCTADLTDQKNISATKDKTITADVGIIAQKDDEIKVLKKPKGFWSRVKTTMKEIGIGFGIGVAVGHRF